MRDGIFFIWSVYSLWALYETRVSFCKVRRNVKRPESEYWGRFFKGQPGATANTRLYVTIPGEVTSRQELQLVTCDHYWSFYEPCAAKIRFTGKGGVLPQAGSVYAAHAGAPGSGRHMWDLVKHTHTRHTKPSSTFYEGQWSIFFWLVYNTSLIHSQGWSEPERSTEAYSSSWEYCSSERTWNVYNGEVNLYAAPLRPVKTETTVKQCNAEGRSSRWR